MIHSSLHKLNPLLFSPKNLTLQSKRTMLSSSSSSSNAARASQTIHQVPGFGSDETGRVYESALQRYTFDGSLKKRGKGVAIVWFRNDLRVLDNEALYKAWAFSEAVLPVYCVDPRMFGKTHYFGFPKTGGSPVLVICLSGFVFKEI